MRWPLVQASSFLNDSVTCGACAAALGQEMLALNAQTVALASAAHPGAIGPAKYSARVIKVCPCQRTPHMWQIERMFCCRSTASVWQTTPEH